MNNTVMRISIFLLILLLGLSCGSGKRAGDKGRVKKLSAENLLDRMSSKAISAEWMDARARIDFDSPDLSVGGTAFIKLKKDSIIWMSVRKFGFEAARAQITPDSVFILDRLNNEFTAEPLAYIERRYRIPASFDLLQQVLLGNPVFFTRDLALQNRENLYYLRGRTDRWQTDYWVSPADFQLQRMQVTEQSSRRTVDLALKNYRPAEGSDAAFSYLREVNLDSPETGAATVELEFNKVELNRPTSIAFDIPSRYDRQSN